MCLLPMALKDQGSGAFTTRAADDCDLDRDKLPLPARIVSDNLPRPLRLEAIALGEATRPRSPRLPATICRSGFDLNCPARDDRRFSG
jgi:hypothetical protein